MAATFSMQSLRRSTLTAAQRRVRRWRVEFLAIGSCLLVAVLFLAMTWRENRSARQMWRAAALHPLELAAEIPAAPTVSVTLIPRRNILPAYVPQNRTLVAVYVVNRKGRRAETDAMLAVPLHRTKTQAPDNSVEAEREIDANRWLNAEHSVGSPRKISPGTVSQIVATINRHLAPALPTPNIDGAELHMVPPDLDVAVTQASEIPTHSVAIPPPTGSVNVQRKTGETPSSAPIVNKPKEAQLAAYVPPRPIKWVKPDVTGLLAIKRFGSADINVKVRIDATGRVVAAHALLDGATHDERLMNAAEAAVRQWVFEPARARGVNVPSEDIVVIRVAGNPH